MDGPHERRPSGKTSQEGRKKKNRERRTCVHVGEKEGETRWISQTTNSKQAEPGQGHEGDGQRVEGERKEKERLTWKRDCFFAG